MKAIVHDRYGSFDLLETREIDPPPVGDGEVLVRVRAAGLHIGDCFCVRGRPFPIRFATGLISPKKGTPGFDFAGTVEAVGKNVTGYSVGDEVFGASESAGTCAELVCVGPDGLAAKPAGLSFEEAAAIPTSALAALHALRDVAKVQAGEKILINGASGGVGTFAVQIARTFGAEVTGVCSTRNIDLVRSLGADHVIDYTREDFAEGGPRFNLILDNIENRSLSDCRRALEPKGMLIVNSGTGAGGLALLIRLVKPLLVSPFVSHDLRRFYSAPNHEDLAVLAKLAESGSLRPVIDRTYPLEKTPEALTYIENGHARGKVVVII